MHRGNGLCQENQKNGQRNQELPFEKAVAIKDVLANHRGTDPLVFETKDEYGNSSKILASANFWINTSNDLINGIDREFGEYVSMDVNSLE